MLVIAMADFPRPDEGIPCSKSWVGSTTEILKAKTAQEDVYCLCLPCIS